MNYLYHLIAMFAISGLLAISLDLLVGHLGLLILCQSVFYAGGAYAFALSTTQWHLPFQLGLLIGIVVGGLLSVPVALALRRLRGDAVVLASLAFLLLFIEMIKNLRTFTGGLDGIQDIPPMGFGSLLIGSPAGFAWASLAFLVISWAFLQRLTGSSIGLFLHALRDYPQLSTALGQDLTGMHLKVFFLAAAIAGLAGCLYATYSTYISPDVFATSSSVMLLVMVLLGGPGSRFGPLAGAMALLILPESIRILGVGNEAIGAIHQVVIGLVLVLFSGLRPKGIFRGYEFR